MATELGLLSLTHLHNNLCSQSQDTQNQNQDQDCQLNPNPLPTNPTSITPTNIAPTTSASWMWNHKGHQEAAEEDSWEVRAFAEDTGNVMGTTWPPRSYTCAFCRREFRSAQALGGHMNVHRRDRARLHQVIPHHHHHPSAAASSNMAAVGPTSSSSFLIPTREFVANGTGLCLLYQFPNPSGGGGSSAANFAAETASPPPAPSTLLSISPYPPGGLNFPAGGDGGSRWRHRDQYRPIRPEERLEGSESGGGGGVEGEVDLELRLGHGPAPS